MDDTIRQAYDKLTRTDRLAIDCVIIAASTTGREIGELNAQFRDVYTQAEVDRHLGRRSGK